jgi:hypothetical protein
MRGILLFISLQNLNPLGPADLGPERGMILKDILLIVGIGGLFAVLLVFWAVRYVQRGKRRRHRSKPAILQNADETESADGASAPRPYRHRRRRRRRREHRSRKPSLAETGGLPPVRSDEPPSSASV